MDRIKQIMFMRLSTAFFILSMLALLIIGVVFLGALNFLVNPKSNPVTFNDYQPVTSNRVSLNLDLSSPEDNLLVFDNNLLVSGKTVPGAMVLITLNDDNQLISAGNQGDFSLTVKLQPGANQLMVSAFDSSGNYKSESRIIYFSEAKL